MLVYIDNTIGEFLKDQELTVDQVMLFNDVGQANLRGLCAACGDVKSIDALIKHKDISSGIMRSLWKNWVEMGSLFQLLDIVFVITCLAKSETRHLPGCIAGKVRYLPIEYAEQWDLRNACFLIGENPRDCAFYEQLGKYFCHIHKVKGYTIKFSPVNGGGSYIGERLIESVRDQKKFSLCVVDMDWRHGFTETFGKPKDGDTYRAVMNAASELHRENLQDMFCVCPLKAHEIENLLPLCVLKRLSTKICKTEGLELIKRMREVRNGEPILYYDFKEGLNRNGDIALCAYWEEIRTELGGLPWEDTYYKIGDKILKETTNLIESEGVEVIELDEYLMQIWDMLGRVLFTWGCVSRCTSS